MVSEPRLLIPSQFLNFVSMDTLPLIALIGVQKEAGHCSSKIVRVKSPSNHFEGYFVENILRKKVASLFPHIMQIKTT